MVLLPVMSVLRVTFSPVSGGTLPPLRRGVIGLTWIHFSHQDSYLYPADTLLDARVYSNLQWYQLAPVSLVVTLLKTLSFVNPSCGVIFCLLWFFPVPPAPAQPSTLWTLFEFFDHEHFVTF